MLSPAQPESGDTKKAGRAMRRQFLLALGGVSLFPLAIIGSLPLRGRDARIDNIRYLEMPQAVSKWEM